MVDHFLQGRYRNKKAEFELSKTLREVTDYKYALDESSIVAITDQKGIIKYANNNFCRISKYDREELIGKDHRIINSGFHPEGAHSQPLDNDRQRRNLERRIKEQSKGRYHLLGGYHDRPLPE